MEKLQRWLAIFFLSVVSIVVAAAFVFAQDKTGTKLPLDPADEVVGAEIAIKIVCPDEQGMLNLLDNWEYWVTNSPDAIPNGCLFSPTGFFMGPYEPLYRYLDGEGDLNIIYNTLGGFWTYSIVGRNQEPNV